MSTTPRSVTTDPLLNGAFETTFVAIDLETTGFSAETDEIVQVAAVRFVDGAPVDSLNVQLVTQSPIPEALRIRMGWAERDPSTLVDPGEAFGQLERFVRSEVAVAWNAEFDLAFLAAGVHIEQPVDGLALAVLADPRGSHRLVDVIDRLGVDPAGAVQTLLGTGSAPLQPHDGLFDAMAAGLIHVQMVEHLTTADPGVVAMIDDINQAEILV